MKSPVRKSHKPTVERLEKQVWSPDQVRQIIEGVAEIYRTFFVCAALTGARLGELLALKWSCFDFQARTIRIERSLWQGELGKPKTKGSVRTIAFGEILAQALTSHMEASVHIGADDFVFCKLDGTPYHPDVLRKDVLYPTLDRLQIPRPVRASGFHAFRHSAATMVSAETGDLKLAQKLLGHSQLATTADVYTHVLREQDATAVEAIEKAVFPESVPNCSKNGSDPTLGTSSEV